MFAANQDAIRQDIKDALFCSGTPTPVSQLSQLKELYNCSFLPGTVCNVNTNFMLSDRAGGSSQAYPTNGQAFSNRTCIASVDHVDDMRSGFEQCHEIEHMYHYFRLANKHGQFPFIGKDACDLSEQPGMDAQLRNLSTDSCLNEFRLSACNLDVSSMFETDYNLRCEEGSLGTSLVMPSELFEGFLCCSNTTPIPYPAIMPEQQGSPFVVSEASKELPADVFAATDSSKVSQHKESVSLDFPTRNLIDASSGLTSHQDGLMSMPSYITSTRQLHNNNSLLASLNLFSNDFIGLNQMAHLLPLPEESMSDDLFDGSNMNASRSISCDLMIEEKASNEQLLFEFDPYGELEVARQAERVSTNFEELNQQNLRISSGSNQHVQTKASMISCNTERAKKTRLPAKNLHAERRRRKKLNDHLYLLRSTVPKISKVHQKHNGRLM